MSRAKPNQTTTDARDRVARARAGSLVAPSLEYLRALREGLHGWLDEVGEKIDELAAARRYEIVVSNVGTVHRGIDRDEAEEEFAQYVEMSQMGSAGGRIGGEDVVLFEDDEPIAEHIAERG